MFGIGAFRPEVYNVTVSGSVPDYDEGQIGLSSRGWCGSASKPSDNWVEIDLKAPKVISAVRILSVSGGKSVVASVRSFTLTYRSLDSAQSMERKNMAIVFEFTDHFENQSSLSMIFLFSRLVGVRISFGNSF